jgi:DNA-binding response OmpR family regulator
MDGKETFAKLQESAPLNTVPVIFITAKVQREEIEQYIELGAAGVITKPFDPISLPDEIETILTRAAKKRELMACTF